MKSLLACLALLCSSGTGFGAATSSDVLVQFAGTVHDMEHDVARSRLYVTVPQMNQLVVVNTNNWQIEQIVTVAPSPKGVALSLDGTQIFVAKAGTGSVAVIDPETLTQLGEIFLSGELDHTATYDVIVAQPNRLYVSANPGSGGFAYIVQVKLDEGNSAQRVASNRIIRCNPSFEGSRDFSSLYIGECFSPASVYKLDLTQAMAPIVAEDNHGTVSWTTILETNPDNSRLHIGSGQVLDSDTLDVVGQIGQSGGIPRFAEDPARIFVAKIPNQIETWNVATQTQLDLMTLPCNFSTIRNFLVLPQETGFLVLGEDRLCGTADLVPCVGSVESVCISAPNSAGPGASLRSIGNPELAPNNFGFSLSGAPAQQFGLVYFGSVSAQLPFGDGWLCISPFEGGLTRLPPVFQTDNSGAAQVMLDFQTPPLLNGPISSFSTWYFQAWYRDLQGPGGLGFNTSDALRVTFCP